jgi:hypothetical protein
MKFLAIDPRWDGGTPSDDLARRFDGVRFVAFPNGWDHVGHYLDMGLLVDLVLARESGDPAQYVGWATDEWFRERLRWIVGNEPDGSGASSWTMTPKQYRVLWKRAAMFLNGERWIAGMCSGDPARAAQYAQHDAAGWVVHLYGLTAEEAVARLLEYQAALPGPLRVGECHQVQGADVDEYLSGLEQHAWVTYFCCCDDMDTGMGLPADW